VKINLNEKCYLFKQSNESKREHLAITAHGMQMPLRLFKSGYGKFKVPEGTTLYFYGPDGSSLNDPGLGNVMREEISFFEKISSGEESNDYLLTKYKDDAYPDIEYGVNCDGIEMDIATIRNRWNVDLGTVKLSEVLQFLSDNGYKYPNVHCVFCRTSFKGWLKEITHDAKNNPSISI
jgi:hypothetical protein